MNGFAAAAFQLIGEITDCLSFRQKQNDNFRPGKWQLQYVSYAHQTKITKHVRCEKF